MINVNCLSCKNSFSVKDGTAINPSCSSCGALPIQLKSDNRQARYIRARCLGCQDIQYYIVDEPVEDYKCHSPLCKSPYLKTLEALTKIPVNAKLNKIDKPVLLTLNEKSYLKKQSFKNDGSPKIAWIQDLEKMGGSELSSNTCVKYGRLLGFDIAGITPSNFNHQILEDADLFIINNFWTFKEDQFPIILNYLFEYDKPYVKYEHDYREIEKRNYTDAWRIFNRARKTIFISPMHEQDHKDHLYLENSIALPLAIDIDVFKNTGTEREPDLWINTSGGFDRKNKDDGWKYIEKNKKKTFEIYSNEDVNGCNLDNLNILPHIANEDLPEVYSRAKGLFHIPYTKWAGERIVFEALLCGMESKNIKINDNVGHGSWFPLLRKKRILNNPVKLAKWLEESVYTFWKEIEGIL